jgi:hypothetical protein
MIRQETEWRIECYDENDNIFHVDFAKTKRGAMCMVNKGIDGAHHIDLCKQRSFYDSEDFDDLVDREYLDYQTFYVKADTE